MGYDKLKIFSGNANRPLAEEIAGYLGLALGRATVKPFADGEIYVRLEENVRGCDTFIIQPTSKSVNHNLVELAIMIDAARRASAKSVIAVLPYYGYARQDRKAAPREPITAKLVANLLTSAGADRILTIDLHSGQIQGFFDIPLDHLYGLPIIRKYFEKKNLPNLAVASPDTGAVKKASKLANSLNASLVILDKRRPSHNAASITNIVGDVSGRNIVIIDDMIDTAGTIVQAVDALKKAGAKDIYVAATHGILSPPAIERLATAPIKEIVVTNSIFMPPELKLQNMTVLSVGPLLAEAIRNVHIGESISRLNEWGENLG